jgi:pentatricopeptide repeat protein
MSLQVPARSGTLRRFLLLSGGAGIPRPYSTGDRSRRVIREAQKDEDEAFLRTLNFGDDPENNLLPPPPRRGRGDPDAPPSAGAAENQQRLQPERSAQKPVGETLLEKLKLGNGDDGAASAMGDGAERQQHPESEPQQKQQQLADVDEIFRKMKETGLVPNAVAMLDGLCKNGLMQDTMKLFGLMREKGAIPEVVIYTAVVDAFCKAAKLDDAVRILRKMQGNGIIPNAFSYWLLIQGLCKGGRLDDAVVFCVEMFEAGLSPNAETFVDMVDAVCKAKGVHEGEMLVRSFQDRNFAIDEKSIRDHLAKKGPFSPVVWEVLLGKKSYRRF